LGIEDVALPVFSFGAAWSPIFVSRSNICYQDIPALIAGERPHVRFALFSAKHIIVVEEKGKPPLVAFFDLQKELNIIPVQNRTTWIHSDREEEISIEMPSAEEHQNQQTLIIQTKTETQQSKKAQEAMKLLHQ